MKVGFIGLGVMGHAIAQHILQAGYSLNIYNRTKQKAEMLIKDGANWYESPANVAEESDIVFTIVGYPSDVEEVYLGQHGLFQSAKSGQIFVDMTTSSPKLARKLSDIGEQQGVMVLDAPVTGGDVGAKRGTLTTLVGGETQALQTITPILEIFCQSIQYFGQAGSGQHAKLANQIMIAGTMLGMTETLCYAHSVGLNTKQVIETLGSGAAANFSLSTYGPRILNGDYSPGFFVKHFIKDLKLALDVAQEESLDLPGTQLALTLYEQLASAGFENDGIQALIKLWSHKKDHKNI